MIVMKWKMVPMHDGVVERSPIDWQAIIDDVTQWAMQSHAFQLLGTSEKPTGTANIALHTILIN